MILETLLVLFQNLSSRQVSRSRGLDVVVLHATDGTVHFEYGQRNLLQAGNSVLPQSLLQLIHGDVLAGHVDGDNFAIVHQQAGLALHQFAESTVPARELLLPDSSAARG